jgi:hypothetical protein
MKSSTRFFKRKTGTRGIRSGNERLSIQTVTRANRGTARRVLAALVTLALSAAPAGAMVGGATLADQAIARHVVLIVGGHSLCSGVAIAPDLVLTAAHCVLENGKYRLVAFEGRRGVVKNAVRVIPHPQFSLRTGENQDLALVKLAPSQSPNLTPAALSGRRTPPSVGERFLVAGFGVATTGERKTAGTLRAATLVVTARPSSQQLRLVDPKKFGEAAGLGVCNGDSGGPVFDERDHTLVGIVSWSERVDGEPVCGFVSGIIPLERYRNWILDTAEKLGSPLVP